MKVLNNNDNINGREVDFFTIFIKQNYEYRKGYIMLNEYRDMSLENIDGMSIYTMMKTLRAIHKVQPFVMDYDVYMDLKATYELVYACLAEKSMLLALPFKR